MFADWLTESESIKISETYLVAEVSSLHCCHQKSHTEVFVTGTLKPSISVTLLLILVLISVTPPPNPAHVRLKLVSGSETLGGSRLVGLPPSESSCITRFVILTLSPPVHLKALVPPWNNTSGENKTTYTL